MVCCYCIFRFPVTQVAQAVHAGFHWWIVACCGLAGARRGGTNEHSEEDEEEEIDEEGAALASNWHDGIGLEQGSEWPPPRPRQEDRGCCYRSFRSCYEVSMVILSASILVGLFIPIILQTQREYEIANFRDESVTMQVEYGAHEGTSTVLLAGTQPALVTVVHGYSSCTDARPELLLSILIVGVVVCILANMPYIVRATGAFKRCFTGKYPDEAASPGQKEGPGYTVYDEELLVLTPASARDFSRRSHKPLSAMIKDCVMSPLYYFEARKSSSTDPTERASDIGCVPVVPAKEGARVLQPKTTARETDSWNYDDYDSGDPTGTGETGTGTDWDNHPETGEMIAVGSGDDGLNKVVCEAEPVYVVDYKAKGIAAGMKDAGGEVSLTTASDEVPFDFDADTAPGEEDEAENTEKKKKKKKSKKKKKKKDKSDV